MVYFCVQAYLQFVTNCTFIRTTCTYSYKLGKVFLNGIHFIAIYFMYYSRAHSSVLTSSGSMKLARNLVMYVDEILIKR
jgi:hypothetical protein